MPDLRRTLRPFTAGLALAALGTTGPADAVSISKIYVGTLSSPTTGVANPGTLARGNRYVVKVTYETAEIASVNASGRLFQTRDFFSAPLDDAPGGTGSLELFLPSEGFGGVLTQTGQDHFVIGGAAPTAEIHFFESCDSEMSCDAAFRGIEFESNFIRTNSSTTPNPAGDLVFELRDPDANFSGTDVTNQVVNVLDGNLAGIVLNGGHVDVRSESSSASGGQLNPGVFLNEAVPVIAEAGASPLVFDAHTLVLTTNGGTELVTDTVTPPTAGTLRSTPSSIDDPTRQADNDLGAGRSDGEDFLSYVWNVDGGPDQAGSETGTRQDRIVDTLNVVNPASAPHGSRYQDDGDRSVDDVNISIGIAASGLTSTTDATSAEVEVTESITGLSDTDTVAITYANAGPTAEAGADLVFDAGNLVRSTSGASLNDPDLVVNATIAGFETVEADFQVDGASLPGNPSASSPVTASTGELVGLAQSVTIAQSGLTSTIDTNTLDLTVADGAGASNTDSAGLSYQNAGPFSLPGPDRAYSASQTSVTTDGGVSDADLAVNAQIGGFESHGFEWTGASGMLGSTEDVTVGIVASGLTTTLDTTTFDLEVTDLAGAADSDSIVVSYDNADPVITNAVATPVGGGDLLFGLAFDDADLGINGLIAGFEKLGVVALLDGALTTDFDTLLATGGQLFDLATLVSLFGAGPHVLEIRVADRVLDAGASFVSAFISFDVPEPGVSALLLGAGALVGVARRRRQAS